jgi:hypothetical protein
MCSSLNAKPSGRHGTEANGGVERAFPMLQTALLDREILTILVLKGCKIGLVWIQGISKQARISSANVLRALFFHFPKRADQSETTPRMLNASRPSVPWICKPCSFARCNMHIKHKCTDKSSTLPAGLSDGTVANT